MRDIVIAPITLRFKIKILIPWFHQHPNLNAYILSGRNMYGSKTTLDKLLLNYYFLFFLSLSHARSGRCNMIFFHTHTFLIHVFFDIPLLIYPSTFIPSTLFITNYRFFTIIINRPNCKKKALKSFLVKRSCNLLKEFYFAGILPWNAAFYLIPFQEQKTALRFSYQLQLNGGMKATGIREPSM